VRRDLQVLYRAGSLVGLTDRQLLERIQSANSVGEHALAEAALTALADRHSAMVWNVCRSLIRDRHDAEDAFQATFLILVRKAGSLRVGETLGPWLHVVAYRTALSVRSAAARRQRVERSAAESLRGAVDSSDPTSGPDAADDLRASIHAEIRNLPEAFRSVVVLCDLEGLSYLEAAGRLEIPLGTVQSRLARARRRLRRGLTLRGVHPSDAGETIDPCGAPILGLSLIGGLPPSLVGRVGRLGALIASDPTCLKTSVAGSVQALISVGLQSMFLGNLKRALVAILGGVLVGGVVLYADAGSGQAGPDATGPLGQRPASHGEVKGKIEIPAPRRLAVESGRGKALLYQLDGKEGRIPLRREGKAVRFREVEREIRWAVVTGMMDHHTVQKGLIMANRKPLHPGHRLYRRVELERQALRQEGSWSNWEEVDMVANLDILDNLHEIEEERVPEAFRDDDLVDPLPHLTQGEWRGVDIADFLPDGKETREDGHFAQAPPLGFQRDKRPVLMVRSLDFTVEPGRTYRYRARVVLINPYYDGKDPRDRKFLFGPWSEATELVTIPRPDGGP
jgi:RNA polymerase sigma factor (sigma-70 family)